MRRKGSAVHAWSVRALRLGVIAALVAVMVPVGVPAASAANVIYWVDNVSGDNANPGTELLPFETITYAVSVADPTDSIRVKPGTYSSANGETLPIVFTGETLRSTGGPLATTIQGNGDQALLVFNIWTSGDMLEGFTIDDGGSAGVSPAVQINLSTGATSPNAPLITNSVFTDNDGISGGALLIQGADTNTAITIESNTFINNSADEGGAVKFASHGSLHMSDNSFETNTAFRGGAVHLETWDAVCTVNGNTFDGNVATGGGGAGGGLYWQGYGSSFQHNLGSNAFWDCTATVAGGAVYLTHVKALVNLTNAAGSSAPFGGFAYLEQGIITAENNYFTGHSAPSAGAVWQLDNDSRLVERNDTLYAQASGPDVVSLDSGGTFSVLDITNCIYWNPLVTNEIEGATSLSYTCSYDDATTLAANGNTVGAGMVYANPGFDTGAGIPVLLGSSPCVDAGNPASYPAVDFFATVRPQGPAPDIGCYEMPQAAPVVLAPVYRFYNFTNNTHFFTPSAEEADSVIANYPKVFRYEGICYYTNPANNTQPLYRFYNRVSASHFYTASAEEAAHITATWPHIFTLDGQTYAVNPAPVPNSSPVYRFFNLRNGSHFYTASPEEADHVIATWPTIYRYEGPAFWIGL